MTHSALNAFLAAVRTRLWAEQILYAVRKMIWLTSVLLLLFSGVHLFRSPPHPWLMLTVVLIAGLAVLIPALLRRPDAAAAARRADRVFAGRTLLTTAEECLRTPGWQQRASGQIVLQQAETAALAWRPMLGNSWQPPRATGFALATIPFFVAMLLFSLPGAGHNSGTGETGTGETGLHPGSAVARPATSPGNERDDVERLREALTAAAVQPEPGAVKTAPADTDLRPQMGGEMPVDAPEQAVSFAADPGAVPGFAADSTAAEDRAGSARSRPASADGDPFAPDHRFQSVTRMDIRRTGRTISTRTDAGDYSGNTDLGPGQRVNTALPASPPQSRPHWTILSPAVAAYARNFLDRTDKPNE